MVTARAPSVEPDSIVESSHDAIIGMTELGTVSTFNQAAAQLYGYTAAEIVGLSAEVLVPLTGRTTEAAILARILAGEQVEPYYAQRVCHDGSIVTVASTISPVRDVAGGIVGAATASRRVNELQEAADRFEARVGQQRADVVDLADRFDTQLDEMRDQTKRALERFDVQVDDERAMAQDGRDRFQTRMASEQAQAQSDKDHLQAQLQQRQRLEALGQLAGGVAHDFNNLLGVILNYAAFVAEELDAQPIADLKAARRDVDRIQRAAERATTLTHQLLAFARREVVQPLVLDLNAIVADVEQLLHRTIGEEVVLKTHLAIDLWPVLADAGQIEQVLLNLAINARDAMSGGGVLTIESANVTVDADFVTSGSPIGPGRYVRLRVTDTGSGMSAEVSEHVFEPFFTTKADGLGTGLGLATVYGIVIQAEGTIDIHSALGVGTTFTIMIPATDRPVEVAEEVHTHRRTLNGETVLIVEDEEALREVTERILTRSGYKVLTAAGGPDAVALAIAYEGDIHLLLTDVVMPTMLGTEVARKIRDIKPGIDVLFMSGYAQPVLGSQGRLDPNVHLIEKPFSAPALIDKAAQILSDHSG
jgi:PAS domain S-box-containing protein